MTHIVRPASFLLFLLLAGCGGEYVEPVDHAQQVKRDVAPIVANDPRGVWLAIYPSQCSTADAWRKDWVNAHDGAHYHPFGRQEMPILIEYCSKRGISVLDSTTQDVDGMRCAACTCPANYILFLLVSEADAMAVAEFGGSPRRPGE
jgi:hypothetical protein